MWRRSRNNSAALFAIADAAIVFSPVNFKGMRGEVETGDVMMRADFRTAQAAEKLSAIFVQASPSL
jgi:hypothetical protein